MVSRIIITILVLLSVFKLNAQISLGGGLNSVAAFGIKNPYLGLNILGEYRQDDLGYSARFYTTLPQNDAAIFVTMDPINQNDSLTLDLGGNLTYNYNVLEVGKRYYFGRDLDFGPALYLNSHFAFMLNSVKVKTDSFDETRYKFPSGYVDKGRIFAVAVGANVGAQYAFYYGTYFLDFGFNYILTGMANNEVASYASTPKQLFFTFNLGFKKTIFADF
jgi:hypothetical protein